MNLGIFLPIGSSFSDQKKIGQDTRFVDYFLKKYAKNFDAVYIFSYKKELYRLPAKCFLVGNKYQLHRFIYTCLLPFINYKILRNITIFRVTQLTGVIPALIAKIICKKPYIFTYGYNYSAFARLEGHMIRATLLEYLEKLAIRYGNRVIVTTKRIQKILNKKYPKAKIYYLPNGVDIDKFKVKNEKLKVFNSNSNIKLLFVGRLEKQKNLINLIKAIALLNKHYKINLLIIGRGKQRIQLIKLADHLNVNLQIKNSVPHDKIIKYYQQADIFCLPSLMEGQPKTLLEALACGLPCLVGNYAGVEEFRNNKELLITGFTAEEITKNLAQLIKNQNLRKKLSLFGRKKVEDCFDINKLVNKEIQILKKTAPAFQAD